MPSAMKFLKLKKQGLKFSYQSSSVLAHQERSKQDFGKSPGRKGNMHITMDAQIPVPVRNMNQARPMI